MKTPRRYKNHSQRARIIAWGIDLTLGSLFKAAAACRQAIRRLFPAATKVPSAARKILLIRLDHIGDLLMTAPAIHALKRRFPESSLSLLASPSSLPIVAASPELDRVFSFHVPWYDGKRAQRFSLPGYLRLLRQLRREHFDAAIDFRGDLRVLWLFSFLSGAKQRLGYAGLGGEFLLTRSCPYDDSRHFVEANLSLADRLEGPPAAPEIRYSITTSPADVAHVGRLFADLGLSAGDKVIGIHPVTIPHWRLKRWPLERFAEVADALARQEGAKILLTGGEEDIPELSHVVSAMREPARVAAGRTSIPQLAELIGRCRLFVANDTGPMHIAVAVGTPLVAIFGPTDPKRSGPFGDPKLIRVICRDVPCRRPCYATKCPLGHECMNGTAVEDVLTACRELLRLPPAEREKRR